MNNHPIQKNKIPPFYEFCTWLFLDEFKNIELILLKGHLMLELSMDSILLKNGIKKIEKFSFYKKVQILKHINSNDKIKQKKIISFLFRINQIRNILAHSYDFEIENSSLMEISNEILIDFNGTKFSKFKNRTKVIHAFSFLTRHLHEIYI